ncbi:hypothetical protein [Marisediminicola sp. LYQ134]|uniref:hypothetical protein n=1 Tax=unclassified Marisediminicola TaxID=2618316 RepID=UPI003983B555
MAGSFAFRRAVLRRTLPQDADWLVWDPMIVQQQAALKFAPISSLLCVGVVIYFGVTEGLVFWTGDAMSAGGAIFLLVMAVFLLVNARDRRVGLRALREQLDARRDSGAPPARGPLE